MESARDRRKSRYAEDPEYYRLTLEDYNAMLAQQNGACAICKMKSDRTLCVDHCHSTGRVRGLLCRKCNLALGFFNDKSSLTQEATVYLKAHGCND